MTSNFSVNRCTRKGFSLVELAIVLGVAGVIMGGLWALASVAQNKARQGETINQVHVVAQGIRNYFKSVIPSNVNLINKLVDSGNIPSDMVVRPLTNPYTVRHALGGLIEVSYNGSTFRIKVEGLKKKDCMDLAPKLTGVHALSGLVQAAIGTAAAVIGPVGMVSLSPEFAAINCPADVAGAGVGAIWLDYSIRAM